MTFMSTHLYGNDYIPVGMARVLADSSDFRLLGSKNGRFLALDVDKLPCKL